ncbi:MAG: ABC transporter permease [Phycisphaerales bacterium]
MPVLLRWLLNLAPTNPITVRLVQNASRRAKHLYVRAGYLAVLILVLLWLLLANTGAGEMSFRDLAAAGARSFSWIAYLQIALICVLAPVFMAGAIAQEADHRTWDILLTTPMSQLQIVLGNLLGRLFFVLALLVASLPLFALTQYFGGVPGESIFASYLIAACAALVVGTIAIALSVSRLVGRRAVFAFYIAVISYLGITAAFDAWLRSSGQGAGPGGTGVTWVTAINPFLALTALLNPSTYPRAEAGSHAGLAALFLEHPVTAWCLLSATLSVALTAMSAVTVRLGGLATIGQGRSGIPLHRRLMGLGAKGAEYRPPRAVWTNPIAWREAAARNATFARMAARWTFVCVGILFGIGLLVTYHVGAMSQTDFRFVLASATWTEMAVITLVAINMAATAISREREDGTLDLILTTPVTPPAYLAGKLRGLIAYLIPLLLVPIIGLAAAGLYSLAGGLGNPAGAVVKSSLPGGGAVTTPLVLPESALVAPLVFIPFTAFCVMVGLHWSLKSKGTIASVIATVGVVGAVGGMISLCAWHSGTQFPVVGPALGALSPASTIYAGVYPEEAAYQTIKDAGLNEARVALVIGAFMAAGAYALIVYLMRANMVRNFDFTVRKLAGTR